MVEYDYSGCDHVGHRFADGTALCIDDRILRITDFTSREIAGLNERKT